MLLELILGLELLLDRELILGLELLRLERIPDRELILGLELLRLERIPDRELILRLDPMLRELILRLDPELRDETEREPLLREETDREPPPLLDIRERPSSSVVGIALQLTVTSGLSLRGLAWWMALARISLPVPLSPRRSTDASLGATLATRPSTACIGLLSATMLSKWNLSTSASRSRTFSS